MIGNALAPYIVAGGLAVAGGVGWWLYGTGYDAGYAAHEAEVAADTKAMQDRLDDLASDNRAKEIALERAERDRTRLERDLADAASDDPMADDPGLGLDSLRRLNRIGPKPIADRGPRSGADSALQ